MYIYTRNIYILGEMCQDTIRLNINIYVYIYMYILDER